MDSHDAEYSALLDERSATEILRQLVCRHELAGEPMPRGLTVAERLAEVIIEQALAGSFEHIKMILDRVEGPVESR